jgi:hypothetical protein
VNMESISGLTGVLGVGGAWAWREELKSVGRGAVDDGGGSSLI